MTSTTFYQDTEMLKSRKEEAKLTEAEQASSYIKRFIKYHRARMLHLLEQEIESCEVYRAAHCVLREVDVDEASIESILKLKNPPAEALQIIEEGRLKKWSYKKTYRLAFQHLSAQQMFWIGW